MKPGFAVSTHFTELHHLSASINSDSPCYIESEVSANEIFKHLKSLKTNLLNVLPFPIKSSVCNYIRPVITKFHDLLCNCVASVCIHLCLCVMCIVYVPIHASYVLKWWITVWECTYKCICVCMCMCVCVCLVGCWRKTRWWEMILLACVQNAFLASLSFVGRQSCHRFCKNAWKWNESLSSHLIKRAYWSGF